MRRNDLRYLPALLGLLIAGCSGSDRPSLGTVTGRVLLDGEPLKNVEMTFSPEKGRPSYARTDDQGNYELQYLPNVMGAKVGTHKVDVVSSKVDTDKLEEVHVRAGKNVIDIECVKKTKPAGAKPASSDEPEEER